MLIRFKEILLNKLQMKITFLFVKFSAHDAVYFVIILSKLLIFPMRTLTPQSLNLGDISSNKIY